MNGKRNLTAMKKEENTNHREGKERRIKANNRKKQTKEEREKLNYNKMNSKEKEKNKNLLKERIV